MQLTITGTPTEIKEFLSKESTKPLATTLEIQEETAVDTQESNDCNLFEKILEVLKGNELFFLPIGSENSITAKTLAYDIIEMIDGYSTDDWNQGINAQLVNYIKPLAADPNSEIKMVDNSALHYPHLFYRTRLS
jgi:hypothetical protein